MQLCPLFQYRAWMLIQIKLWLTISDFMNRKGMVLSTYPFHISNSIRPYRTLICNHRQASICQTKLAYHEITTQIPHEVYLALNRGAEPPRLGNPPIRIFWFTGQAFTQGIENGILDGVQVRIYSPEKTIADCFKYRNKIGLDTAI